MKIVNLTRSEDGTVTSLDMDLTDEEAKYFIALSFNILLQKGLLAIDAETKNVTFVATPQETVDE